MEVSLQSYGVGYRYRWIDLSTITIKNIYMELGKPFFVTGNYGTLHYAPETHLAVFFLEFTT